MLVLTVFELWLACDKLATGICPLLNQYNPGIPLGPLQNLVFPCKEQMARLCRIEEYIANRSRNCRFTWRRLFIDVGSSDCFSVRYFDQSQEHQALHSRIESRAQDKRDEKRL